MSARRRWIAGLAGLSLVTGVLLVPSSETTDAAWTDAEYTATATFTAAVLAPPQSFVIHGCAGLLGAGVTIDWSWPASAPYTGFTPALNAQWAYNAAGDNWQAVATTVAPSGAYRTAFNTGIIGGLLTFLLGGAMTIKARTKAGTHWVSGPSVKVVYETGLFGTQCSLVP